MPMRELTIGFILFLAQLNPLQPRPVVHLQPHKSVIEARFNGDSVELINAPDIVHLPVSPPKPDSQGIPWSVEVKNLGPNPVTILNKITHFRVLIHVGQTLHIQSSGSKYVLKR